MSLYYHALELVRDCESRLRALISEAAAAGELEELKAVADLAMALRKLVPANPAPSPQNGISATTSNPAPARQQGRSHVYPRFEVEADRLVKIGWSKRERAEYEHKVPKPIAQAAFSALLKAAGSVPFRMEDLFPFLLIEGKMIPSYQSYLVLSWLRNMELIDKVGKDSYRWAAKEIDEESFEEFWGATAQSC